MSKNHSGADLLAVLVVGAALNCAMAAGFGFIFPGVMSFWQWLTCVMLFWVLVNSLKTKRG